MSLTSMTCRCTNDRRIFCTVSTETLSAKITKADGRSFKGAGAVGVWVG